MTGGNFCYPMSSSSYIMLNWRVRLTFLLLCLKCRRKRSVKLFGNCIASNEPVGVFSSQSCTPTRIVFFFCTVQQSHPLHLLSNQLSFPHSLHLCSISPLWSYRTATCQYQLWNSSVCWVIYSIFHCPNHLRLTSLASSPKHAKFCSANVANPGPVHPRYSQTEP